MEINILDNINKISTHTLTWSVTVILLLSLQMSIISTHTLTWSVTIAENKSGGISKFQLTRSRGA